MLSEEQAKETPDQLAEDTRLLADILEETPIDDEGDPDDPHLQSSLYSMKSSQKMESSASIGAMTLVKYVIALGILALPYVAARVGIVPAWILIITVGYLNLYSLRLLDSVASSVNLQKVDVGRLCERVSRNLKFRHFAEFNLHIMCVGACISDIVFISKYISQSSCVLGWVFCDRTWLQFVLILVLVLPVMTITDIHYLAYPNTIALTFQIMFVITFIVASISLIETNGVASGGLEAALTKFDYSALPCAFTTILFSYEGVGVFFEIRSSVKESSELMKMLNWGFVLSAVIYIIFGTVSVLAYGDATESIIFLNLNQRNTFFIIIEFGYLVAIILGIPTGLFSITRIIENYQIFRSFIQDENKKGTKSKWKRQLIRLPLATLICGTAMIIPSFNSFLSFLSGINFTIMTCVIPVILYYIQFKNDPDRRFKRLMNWFVLGIGIVLGAIATVQSVMEMVNPTTSTTAGGTTTTSTYAG